MCADSRWRRRPIARRLIVLRDDVGGFARFIHVRDVDASTAALVVGDTAQPLAPRRESGFDFADFVGEVDGGTDAWLSASRDKNGPLRFRSG